jgi:modulator of FtsH protease
MEGWDNFFLGQLGASAALGGLLFVAVSLNLDRILAITPLPDRALVALCLLLAVLVQSSLMLIPGQPLVVIGIESLLIGTALIALGTRPKSRGEAEPTGVHKTGINRALFGVAVLPYLVGGIVILAGDLRAGLYFVAAAIILSFGKAVLDAWVLLVEINR